MRKTTRKLNCYKDVAALPSPPLKRAYDFDDFGMSDDNDDGMSDTTDSGSEVSIKYDIWNFLKRAKHTLAF